MRAWIRFRLFLWRFRRPRFHAGEIVVNWYALLLGTMNTAKLASYRGPYLGYLGHGKYVINELWNTADGSAVAAGFYWRALE